ncbi:hypothetical protein [Asticcacaulis endophyticus]|nr:hypothetical protein [Asticcacaulis endophyticus]
MYEYTSGRDFTFSQTNNLINNLKKKPSLAGTAQYAWKARAIEQCAREFRGALDSGWISTTTFVPVPGSKAPGHPDFDNRIELICQSLGQNVDVRNLVTQSQSTAASHEVGVGERVTVNELNSIYAINENLAAPPPTYLAVVDDVLTAGTHFRAMKTALTARFPGIPVAGLFVARRVFATPPEPADFDIIDF